jgi:hypothetical protein
MQICITAKNARRRVPASVDTPSVDTPEQRQAEPGAYELRTAMGVR